MFQLSDHLGYGCFFNFVPPGMASLATRSRSRRNTFALAFSERQRQAKTSAAVGFTRKFFLYFRENIKFAKKDLQTLLSAHLKHENFNKMFLKCMNKVSKNFPFLPLFFIFFLSCWYLSRNFKEELPSDFLALD
jgi:hypothetical protein